MKKKNKKPKLWPCWLVTPGDGQPALWIVARSAGAALINAERLLKLRRRKSEAFHVASRGTADYLPALKNPHLQVEERTE